MHEIGNKDMFVVKVNFFIIEEMYFPRLEKIKDYLFPCFSKRY